MRLEYGKHRGKDLADVSTEYLKWATVHLPLDAKGWDGVMAEYGRRLNKERVDAESPARKILDKIEHPINKIIARVMMRIRGY